MSKKDTAKTNAKPLNGSVSDALDRYFKNLDGHDPDDLYQLFMGEVERPLLQRVLKYTDGNQTRAAAVLGINRGTLRKKLIQYGLS
ncbi:MAG: DNA-binding transcriptional regulator Fis [Gammaproteobacteria bacterium]|nr:DNA-binding transcriptional regulator Fis [Gammaproteobacteria bacterium]